MGHLSTYALRGLGRGSTVELDKEEKEEEEGGCRLRTKEAKDSITPSDEQDEIGRRFKVAEKKITTNDIIHVSVVEFCAESNGATRGAEIWSKKKRTQKNYKKRQNVG